LQRITQTIQVTQKQFIAEVSAKVFGVEMLQAQDMVKISSHNNYHTVHTADGSEYSAKALLLATGSRYKRLGAPGEDDFIGAGIHFCATCDGPFYKSQSVAVIGGGNSAAEESLFLVKFVEKVTLLVRGDKLSASQVIREKTLNHPQIDVRFHTEVTQFSGTGGKLKEVTIKDRETGQAETIHLSGVFVFIGLTPKLMFLETRVPGIFAAGDVRQGSTKQVASAEGEGATAALLIREYLKSV
jgi:thioredoxin reductase (NADPH)